MEFLELIRVAESAPQVLATLAAYADSLREASALPQWWLESPLENTRQAQERTLELFAMVHAASLRLDNRRCAEAKAALRVFACAVARLSPGGRPHLVRFRRAAPAPTA
jgi:hypothetical protein